MSFVMGEKHTLHLGHFLERAKILDTFSHIFLLDSYFSNHVTAQCQGRMGSQLH